MSIERTDILLTEANEVDYAAGERCGASCDMEGMSAR